MQKNFFSNFIAIDVSKHKLDIYQTNSQSYLTLTNDMIGIKKFLKTITPDPQTLVLVDLTGGYETLLVNHLDTNGFYVHRAQGRKVRQFISSYGQR